MVQFVVEQNCVHFESARDNISNRKYGQIDRLSSYLDAASHFADIGVGKHIYAFLLLVISISVQLPSKYLVTV